MSSDKKIINQTILICIALLLPLLPTISYTAERRDNFIIEKATLNPSDTGYTLDADIKLGLNTEVLKALQHGIDLQIVVEIILEQSREWLWDKSIAKTILIQMLQYQPLSNQYLVSKTNTGDKNYFEDLQHALRFMGLIREYPVFTHIKPQQNQIYTVQIHVYLDTASLPTPLRLSTHIDPDWQLSSQRLIWELKQ